MLMAVPMMMIIAMTMLKKSVNKMWDHQSHAQLGVAATLAALSRGTGIYLEM